MVFASPHFLNSAFKGGLSIKDSLITFLSFVGTLSTVSQWYHVSYPSGQIILKVSK